MAEGSLELSQIRKPSRKVINNFTCVDSLRQVVFLGYLSAFATLAPYSFGYRNAKERLKVKCVHDVIQSIENPDFFVEVKQVRFSFKKLDPDI